jgi:hypothetical protein
MRKEGLVLPQPDLTDRLARSRDRRLACGELGEDVQALSGLLASTAGRSRDIGIQPPPTLPTIITALGDWSVELRRHGALPVDPVAREPQRGLFEPQGTPEPDQLVPPRPRRKPRFVAVVAVLVAIGILAVAGILAVSPPAVRCGGRRPAGAGSGRWLRPSTPAVDRDLHGCQAACRR